MGEPKSICRMVALLGFVLCTWAHGPVLADAGREKIEEVSVFPSHDAGLGGRKQHHTPSGAHIDPSTSSNAIMQRAQPLLRREQ